VQRLQKWLQPHVVLLDVGMATELTSEDRGNMFNLFKSFAEKNGRGMALAALAFAGTEQRCINREGFITAIEEYAPCAYKIFMSMSIICSSVPISEQCSSFTSDTSVCVMRFVCWTVVLNCQNALRTQACQKWTKTLLS
jgi:hypothetical protein